MKTIAKMVLICTMILPLIQACVGEWEHAYYLKNNADYSISTLKLLDSWSQEIEIYSDTTLPNEVASYSWSEAPKGRTANFWPNSVELEYFMNRRNIDTICMFVFETEAIQQLSWDSIRLSYHVLQRYDLSVYDVNSYYPEICFPPSEAMKHIHMWPPYGTYDENGNRKTIK